jgi:ParB-like chromosome segregation protein Spo0J
VPALSFETERISAELADLAFDPHNANKHSAEGIAALAASIAAIGVLEDPIVYRSNGQLCLLAGEGRVRAMLRLGWKTAYVRCLLGAVSGQQARDYGLIHNVLAEKIDLYAFGLYCRDEMQRSGRSARQLAQVLQNKYSPSTITRAVARIEKLAPALHQWMREGRLPGDAANALTTLPDPDAQQRFARLYLDGQVKTAQELAAAIKAARQGHAAGAPSSFTAQAGGLAITVTLPAGGEPAHAAPALRALARDVLAHGSSLAALKDYLARKQKLDTARQAAQAAEDALNAAP